VIERWKAIAGYEGRYEVSDKGHVRSLARTAFNGKATHKLRNRVLVRCKGGHGYLVVSLWKNGETTKRTIHRLVAEAFIPNTYDLPEVNHKDGIKTHITSDNLEWSTHQNNTKHAFAAGLNAKGEDRTQAKLTDKAVRAIRKAGAIGYTQSCLAKQWGVSKSVISRILLRKVWAHVS